MNIGHFRALPNPRQCPRDVPPPVARCTPLRRYQTFARRPPFARHTALLDATTPPQRKPRASARGGVRGGGPERRAEAAAKEAQHLLALR